MSESADEAAIREHMRDLYRAFREHDVATLDRVLADDFTFSDPNGPVMSKQRWLADIAAGNLVFEEVETGPVVFKHLGDRALVEGEATLRVRYTESDYTGTFRYLGVYAREGEGWRLVLTSANRVGGPGE
jgi:ketosteroid isomerase-like protein